MTGNENPLDAQEQRYLNALKLFIERSENPKHRQAAIDLDELSPKEQRAMIASYHLALEDPQTFMFARKLAHIVSWVAHPWVSLRHLFSRCR
jgi:hypothetical protein